MSIVLLLVARDDADVVDANIAFHLGVGVDFVIAADHESADGTTDILESYVRAGVLRRLPRSGPADDELWRTDMARLATEEHGAHWIVDAEVDEFWMPRAEGIPEVLAAMPKRYGVVQGLVRVFPPVGGGAEPFAERMTARRPLVDLGSDESMGRLDWALRPLHRVLPGMTVAGDREAVLDGRVPLRAWYPFEVLRFPVRSRAQAERKLAGRSGTTEPRSQVETALFADADSFEELWAELAVGEGSLQAGLADGAFVEDVRLRDALREVSSPSTASLQETHTPVRRLELEVPSVVADVAYAGECAAVREVDFEPLRDRITELERRIEALETGPVLRLRRRLARLVRR